MNRSRLPVLSVLAGALMLALSACSQGDSSTASSAVAAAQAAPAAPAQETAIARSQQGEVRITTVAAGLENPWALAFLPDGRMLVTERPGRMRIVAADGTLSEPLSGVPPVVAEGQGGLFDVQLAPDFDSSARIYFSYAEPGEGKLASTAVAHARLTDSGLEDVQVIFSQEPKLDTRHHFGSRLVFDGEGHVFITLGDRGVRPTAQDLSSHMGGVIRVNLDGSVPADNPFLSTEGALPEFWSYGHRNQQGAARNPWTGALWTHEHGPKGGDEINIPQPGKNYGWPLATHGINYSGEPIPEATGSSAPGTEQPHHYWPVSPGISGMAFYDHSRFPAWEKSVFIGALAQRNLIRLSLDGDAVTGEERLLTEQGWRIRDVRVGPDGAVYVVTDEPNGRIAKLELAG
jgi:glucose/arabinose dehydrogenase